MPRGRQTCTSLKCRVRLAISTVKFSLWLPGSVGGYSRSKPLASNVLSSSASSSATRNSKHGARESENLCEKSGLQLAPVGALVSRSGTTVASSAGVMLHWEHHSASGGAAERDELVPSVKV